MISKEIYPKTERIKINGIKVQITEKLDGSNLCFFKLADELYIAMRSNIITLDDVINDYDNVKDILYTNLKEWLVENGSKLKKSLNENSAVCGEWISMGKLKYNDFTNKFHMFAKANVYDNLKLEKLKYDHSLFMYPFVDKTVPSFINFVPLVEEINFFPNIEYLNDLYNNYSKKVNRNVEGFVVNFDDKISKYVRMKRGKVQDHFDKE